MASEPMIATSSASTAEFASQYDYVMVFPREKVADGYKNFNETNRIVERLLGAGLEIFPYNSVQEDELLVLIRCPLERLKNFADTFDFSMNLDAAEVESMLKAGNPKGQIKKIHINDELGGSLTPFTPYEYLYGKYDTDINQRLYAVDSDESNCFKESTRLKLIAHIIEAPARQGGCALSYKKLLHSGAILAFYPLHHRTTGPRILAQMMAPLTMTWNVPVDKVKEYFGEKTALFFCFLASYSKFLVLPAVIGFIFQIIVLATGDYSSPVLPFFSVFICLWSIVMLEGWKREEQMVALRWGMLDFERHEPERPEYKGDEILSFIDGEPMIYFPDDEADKRANISIVVIGSMCMLVTGVVAGIYVLRFSVQSQIGSYASLMASALNTIQITVFNMIYSGLAEMLTKYENHRTDTKFEDSLIVKLFMFQFVNSYASFFFLAFIASYLPRPDDIDENFTGECGAETCMTPLAINLAIIFGSRLTVTNLLSLGLPYKAYKDKIAKETAGTEGKAVTIAEKDYVLMPYNILMESIEMYAGTAIQYGFMTLFITALPAACFLAVLNNYAKVKMEAWKMFTLYQRPVPQGAQDIGSWQAIFTIISVISVITNAAMVCFTMNCLDGYSTLTRVWLFIAFQWVGISVQFGTAAIIPDVPDCVDIQQRRNEFIVSKLIDQTKDENYGNEDGETTTANPIVGRRGSVSLKNLKGGANHSDAPRYPDVTSNAYPHTLPSSGKWPSPTKLVLSTNA